MKTIISIHSLRVEGDPAATSEEGVDKIFQSTPSVWRETTSKPSQQSDTIFQSTPSVWRETNFLQPKAPRLGHFNPLPPCGGRLTTPDRQREWTYFNPLPPCGGRRKSVQLVHDDRVISIHSLRVEGDCDNIFFCGRGKNFNPLPPCGGRREHPPPEHTRGADFNPLPPCGGRPSTLTRSSAEGVISIHSLRVEGDYFRRALILDFAISIHSLRVEGDRTDQDGAATLIDFNPLPPCGGRHQGQKRAQTHPQFQSTPSVWRETQGNRHHRANNQFQSTPSVWRETGK